MTDDKLIQELREMHYPGKVDVVDAVMLEVGNRPMLVPATRKFSIGKISLTAAACALLAVAINVVSLYTQDFNIVQIGGDLATVYNYHAGYGQDNVTAYSIGGVEYLFDE